MRSNEELMLAYQQGETEAFSLVYERLHEPLYCFLFRYTREEQLSVDTVQDAFEVLQKKQQLYKVESGTVKAYVFQIFSLYGSDRACPNVPL